MARIEVLAEVTGKVWKIQMLEGVSVNEDDSIMIIEAMKMENVLKAEGVGVVGAILISEGDVVDKGTVLIEFI